MEREKKGFLSCLKVDCYYHIIKSNNHVQTVQNEALNVCELCVCVCVQVDERLLEGERGTGRQEERQTERQRQR